MKLLLSEKETLSTPINESYLRVESLSKSLNIRSELLVFFIRLSIVSILLFNFLGKNNINLNKLSNLFVNQGPGNFSGIRTSITTAKGLSITNNLNLYGFNSDDLKKMDYMNIIFLFDSPLLLIIAKPSKYTPATVRIL